MLSLLRAWVQSLCRELRSQKLHGMDTNNDDDDKIKEFVIEEADLKIKGRKHLKELSTIRNYIVHLLILLLCPISNI